MYRVVMFDQRGCGRSTPSASNTTNHLLADMEQLREHLRIQKWHLVFGGSWGSTLALLYAQKNPDRVKSMVLRGVFAGTSAEVRWARPVAGFGASRFFPEEHRAYIEHLPPEDRTDPVQGYHNLLVSDDPETSLQAARAHNRWDMTISKLRFDQRALANLDNGRWSLAHAKIEMHYCKHHFWIEEGQLLKKDSVDRIRHIPSELHYANRGCSVLASRIGIG